MADTEKQERFTALDITRFVAALAVVLYHYTYRPSIGLDNTLSAFTQFGYLGVPLFFLISGFVICASAQNRTALQFAASRFARLYPAYWAGIAVTLTVLFVLTDYSVSTFGVLANMTMANEYLGIASIDGVYWTLHAELKFYAITFFLILTGIFDRYKIWLTIWLACAGLYHFTDQPSFMGWFISPAYSPLFIAGITFFLMWRDGRTHYLMSVLSVAGALAMLKAYTQAAGFISNVTEAERITAMSLTGAFFILFWLLYTNRLRFRARPVYLILGGLTYPLYLIHNRAGKALITAIDNAVPYWLAVIMTTSAVLLLSLGISQYIEKPFATPLKRRLLKLAGPVETWLKLTKR